MPVLGYLFGAKDKERHQDDILVALIPHIIRAPTTGDLNAGGVLAGTERVMRVERVADTPPAAVQPIPATTPPARTPLVVPPPPSGQATLLAPTQNQRLPLSTPQLTPTVLQTPPSNTTKPAPAGTPPPTATPPVGGAKGQRNP
jgi:hypothetical protein